MYSYIKDIIYNYKKDKGLMVIMLFLLICIVVTFIVNNLGFREINCSAQEIQQLNVIQIIFFIVFFLLVFLQEIFGKTGHDFLMIVCLVLLLVMFNFWMWVTFGNIDRILGIN